MISPIRRRDGTGKIRFKSLSYTGDNPSLAYYPYTNGSLEISVNLISSASCSVGSIAVVIFDRYGTKLVNADTLSHGETIALHAGRNAVTFRVDQLHLNPGMYTIGLWVADPPIEVYDYLASAALFEVVEVEKEGIRVQSDGLVPVKFQILDVVRS